MTPDCTRGQTRDVTPGASHTSAPTFTIEAAAPRLPHDISRLAAAAEAEGIRIVSTVIDRWIDHTQRYDRPGESLLVALADTEVVGHARSASIW